MSYYTVQEYVDDHSLNRGEILPMTDLKDSFNLTLMTIGPDQLITSYVLDPKPSKFSKTGEMTIPSFW